jgi:hypothetical protein
MPGDPKECRQRALNCMHLAQEASSSEERQRFSDLASTWLKLAAEIEADKILIEAFDVKPSVLPSDDDKPPLPAAVDG